MNILQQVKMIRNLDLVFQMVNAGNWIGFTKSNYNVLGIHSHIGSQIFETAGFVRAIEVLRQF